jgi:preprotein translocase subunit SecF
LIVWGPPAAGIDFTGGSLLEIRFEDGQRPAPAEVVALAEAVGVEGAVVQTAGETDLVIRSRPIPEERRTVLLDSLEEAAGSVTLLRDEHVGPSIGAEVGQRAVGRWRWPC